MPLQVYTVLLTFKFHSHIEALLEAAVGAAFPLRLVDMARTVVHAGVDLLVLYSTLKKPCNIGKVAWKSVTGGYRKDSSEVSHWGLQERQQ